MPGPAARPKQAIQYHYDVSNRFYELFLDKRMVYSCAYFQDWHDDIDKGRRTSSNDLPQAAAAPGERFLDIGCGWARS